ncbi:ABC transporter permease [Salinispora mooreana]|uniref:ABC transporter permease n=1 Tax=Salinispora mooreana TaxID=999545 RepID=UPI00036E9846|nr:hypothetical protein [Salinispora mooreana]
MRVATIGGLAVADFKDRVRRPAYAVILLAAVGLGYVAAPASDARWAVMYIGHHRGEYNSAYIGTLIALTSALWLTLGGFYVVRNAISRDESTGVGQLLAATPLRSVDYLLGKFLSSCLTLTSMVGVLAITAMVLQVARGEDRSIDPIALLTPFVVIAIPLVAFTAAMALLFESVPLLRSGLGNILWFFVWLVVAIGGQSPGAPLSGIGVHAVAESMARAMANQGIDNSEGGFSLGLVYLDNPLRTFTWDGLDLTAGYLGGRLSMIVLAMLLAVVPALWFARFDPSRGHGPVPGNAVDPVGPAVEGPDLPMAVVPSAAGRPATTTAAASVAILPAKGVRRPGGYLRLLTGEFRILIQGVSRWWWLGALLITVLGLTLPFDGVILAILPLSWVWPMLVWSRLGTQRYEYGVDAILGAYPWARRRLLAEWAAGVVLTALVGIAPAIRMLAAADAPGLAAWAAGALFIPSLALALGVLSRTHRLFQAIFVMWWYAAINDIAFLDFMGTARVDGVPAGPSPALFVGAAVVLVGLALVVGSARRNART